MGDKAVVFCVMAEDVQGLRQAGLFVESLRKFGGAFSGEPVRVYQSAGLDPRPPVRWAGDVSIYPIPKMAEECRPYFFASKVYCAAHAEAELEDEEAQLVWVDEDTIILDEPVACSLAPDKVAAFCPVMHNRTGVAWGTEPGELWRFLDPLFQIDQNNLSPLTTPADEALIRPYYNAGLMVIRPEQRLMRAWKEQFVPLCGHPDVVDIVTRHPDDRIFLHQVVLTQVLLSSAGQDRIEVLPRFYNYPLFFNELFSAVRDFDDLSEAITARYDVYFRNPQSGWENRLKGPEDKIDWLTKKLQALVR